MIHRRLLSLAGGVLGWISVSVVVMLLTAAISIALSLSIAALLTAAVTRDGDAFVRAATTAAALLAGWGLATWCQEVAITWVGIRIRRRLRGVLLGHLNALGPAATAEQRSGELATTIVDGIEALDPYYSRYLPSLIVTCTLPLAVIVGIWTFAPASALVLLVAVLVAVVPARLFDATLLSRGTERWTQQQHLSADYLDAIQAIPTLRTLGATEAVGATLSAQAWRLYRLTMRQLKVSLIESGVTGLAVYGGTAAAIVIAALGAWRGEISIGEAFLVLVLSREVFRPVNALGVAWHAGYLGLTAADGIDAFLRIAPKITFDGHDDTPAAPGSGIRFHDVSYRYRDDAQAPALEHVEVSIAGGRTTAIIGASGSGKTTLVRLLQRMDDPTTGEVVLDGRPLTSLTRRALTSSMAVVSQHSTVFAGTVADNIALGSPDATRDAIEAAACAAEADAFIRALPSGYDTVVGELGAGLSGGQRQRLAIARALLQDHPLLVLDEATAHLDVRTEAAIARNLSQRRGRTTIIITHRLDSVRDADDIILIERGSIIAQGPFHRVQQAPAYQRLLAVTP